MGRWGHYLDCAPLLRQRWDALWQAAAFGRAVLVRRIAAAMLVAFAAIVALYPQQDGFPGDAVVVAARDLSPGTVVEASQLTMRLLPVDAIPDGATKAPAAVLGRTLAAPVRRGEILTDVRLTGPDLARSVLNNPEMVSVPLRLEAVKNQGGLFGFGVR
jgi:Flp pilus assembly protein CpaB